MKYGMFIVAIATSLLTACGAEPGGIDCSPGISLEAGSGPVCVIEGDLLIETGFQCPEELHYQHQYGGYAVCTSQTELTDDVRKTIDQLGPTNNVPGGSCANVVCRLDERCVAGRCLSDAPVCIGEVCEQGQNDRDNDGVADLADNCPGRTNVDQLDSDGDGVGDACDAPSDTDGDGVFDRFDNCPRVANADQLDRDGDGIGDVCDDCDGGDLDGDGLSACDERDLGTSDALADTDGDGVSDAQEVDLGLNPLVSDTDADGLSDGAELQYGLQPGLPSSFKDGVMDGDRRFIESCEKGEMLVDRDVSGSDALRAVLPSRTTTSAVPVSTANSTNRRAAWRFEDLPNGVIGFVASRAKRAGDEPTKLLVETLGTSRGVTPFVTPDGRSGAIVRGLDHGTDSLERVRDEQLASFVPFANVTPLGGGHATERPFGSYLIVDEGNDLIMMAAFADAASPEARTSGTWLEHVVSDTTFQSLGTLSPRCVVVGKAQESAPIDVIIAVDGMTSRTRLHTFRDLLPVLHRRANAGNDDVRFIVVPLSEAIGGTQLGGWQRSLADVAGSYDAVVNCTGCAFDGSLGAAREVASYFSSSTQHSVRPDAIVNMVVVTDRSPSETIVAPDPVVQARLRSASDFIGSRMTMDLFGDPAVCVGERSDWASMALRTGGTASGLCGSGAVVADDVAVRWVAQASSMELPAGIPVSSIRLFVGELPLTPSREDGFYVRSDIGKIAFFGSSRPDGDAHQGARRPHVSIRYDAID